MSEFLENIYVYLWGALALLTVIVGIKQRAVYPFIIALFFIFMTIWYGLRTFGEYEMFSGSLGVIFRIVCLVFLAAIVGFYIFYRKKSGK